MEWLKKFFEQIKTLWGKWTAVQKVILFVVIGGVVLALVLIVTFSASPSKVALIGVPITDEETFSRIVTRLDEEGINYTVTADQSIMVNDEQTARQARAILIREDLIPSETDPWAIFDVERWTLTDFERDVNLRRAITRTVEQHIRALEDIDAVSVNLVMPDEQLFADQQNPVTASVIITPKPGSDITENRGKIEGIVRLIQFAVEGLSEENITITTQSGVLLNDFTGLEDIDRIELTRRQLRVVRELENQYKASILESLRNIYGPERVQIIDIDISMDLREMTVQTEEHYPITMRPDNPSTPYDESEYVESITLSRSTSEENYEGTGFNPEGPPGQEGQTPPAYRDLEGLVGSYSSSNVTENEVVNTRNITEEKSPWEIERVTVAVALNGIWRRIYNDNGELDINPDGSINREYIPVDGNELTAAQDLIEHAVGYNQERGDSVSVRHIQFDRTSQFAEEDRDYRQQMVLRRTILYVLIGLAILLVAFIAFRLISREIERRRRLREEELSRQHQAMREAALRSAEEEGVEVEMSVEERARLEMQENAINMAREHPEDVAQLIRSWLMEE
ncbi:MAG: flagellar basal-body MS-ring/collar protein FliF [Spirochaetia bacterium]